MKMNTNVISEQGNAASVEPVNIPQLADRIQAGKAVSVSLEDLRAVSTELRQRGAIVIGAL